MLYKVLCSIGKLVYSGIASKKLKMVLVSNDLSLKSAQTNIINSFFLGIQFAEVVDKKKMEN